jgi:hypothetical protein
VYRGDRRFEMAPGIEALPLASIEAVLADL